MQAVEVAAVMVKKQLRASRDRPPFTPHPLLLGPGGVSRLEDDATDGCAGRWGGVCRNLYSETRVRDRSKMADYSKAAQGTVTQPAWSGSMDDLKSLVAQVEDLTGYIRGVVEPQAKAGLEARIAEIEAGNARYEYMRDEYIERETAEARERYEKWLHDVTRTEITVRQRRWGLRLQGTLEDILPEISPDDVERIEIEVGRSAYVRDYRIKVALGSPGAVAEFSGPDTKWIDLASTRLHGEFKTRLPKYWWLRTWKGSVAIAMLAVPAVLAVITLTSNLEFPYRVALTAALAIGIGGFSGLWLPRLAPAFEIYSTPAPSGSHSARQIRKFGALIWGAVAAVVIPIGLMFLQFALTPK